MAKARTKKPIDGTGTTSGATHVGSQDDIARRAYEFYVARGRKNGHDIDDWLRAEREFQRNVANA